MIRPRGEISSIRMQAALMAKEIRFARECRRPDVVSVRSQRRGGRGARRNSCASGGIEVTLSRV